MFQSLKIVLACCIAAGITPATAAGEGDYYDGVSKVDPPAAYSAGKKISRRDGHNILPTPDKADETPPRVNSGDYWTGAIRPH
jgi:hypothetical protein